ncbi:ABC-type transport system involved in multi-copper enzyme maturation permease subunit [Clostridium tetanomorphum]|uniref:DUF5050 domain-containing protein n=1 Tax=Clostridium tetanomorphum TaxID=1553 RepID=A0A923ED38_CLOTT|nr:hypothetical protein [Clostridium tetanomorphum]KAJ51191.1 hypothetical protein CTM_14153 [Clostridium tetanomorphum DSM 665]MBC2399784.1 hypothetical protein [Clostridium tetanomorphum]MBP1864234.1 ABC-type transport system involved in multi-copper enzyme maturation permease subunit [Clostridium tetanomorphum]NRS83682.1 ABC-type transport system involved in multi-copper enzyme maturation permease subunit [Clostridium tetanomorphum]NRZ96874.1 ABC-type transport system involved in multi-copp
MKKKLFFLFIIFFIVICSACNNESVNSNAIQYNHQELNKNEIFLYNIPEEKLGIYDKNRCEWRPLYPKDNLFQYVFNNESKYVVSGHSIENGFVLLKVDENRKSIRKIFDLNNNNDCFFPLANDNNNFYYVMYEDEKNTKNIKRTIFTFDKNNKIHTILNTNDLITSGIIINGFMYYTVCNPNKESYSVYSIDLSNEGEKKAKIVKSDLETRELYNIDNKLYFSSKDKIFNDDQSFDKKYENFFVKNLLIQMYSDSNNDMICSVMDIKTKKIIDKFKYPINFEVKDNLLYIYCNNNIYKLTIGE